MDVQTAYAFFEKLLKIIIICDDDIGIEKIINEQIIVNYKYKIHNCIKHIFYEINRQIDNVNISIKLFECLKVIYGKKITKSSFNYINHKDNWTVKKIKTLINYANLQKYKILLKNETILKLNKSECIDIINNVNYANISKNYYDHEYITLCDCVNNCIDIEESVKTKKITIMSIINFECIMTEFYKKDKSIIIEKVVVGNKIYVQFDYKNIKEIDATKKIFNFMENINKKINNSVKNINDNINETFDDITETINDSINMFNPFHSLSKINMNEESEETENSQVKKKTLLKTKNEIMNEFVNNFTNELKKILQLRSTDNLVIIYNHKLNVHVIIFEPKIYIYNKIYNETKKYGKILFESVFINNNMYASNMFDRNRLIYS
jgi:hypothetical protein